jgi:hypothetical protein
MRLDQSPSKDYPNAILNGFWGRAAEAVLNSTTDYSVRKNSFPCMNHSSNVLSLPFLNGSHPRQEDRAASAPHSSKASWAAQCKLRGFNCESEC